MWPFGGPQIRPCPRDPSPLSTWWCQSSSLECTSAGWGRGRRLRKDSQQLSRAGLVLSCISITQAGHFAVNLGEVKGGRHRGQLWSPEPWLTSVFGQRRASPGWSGREGAACTISVFLMPRLLIGHAYVKAFTPPPVCLCSTAPKPESHGLFYETTHSLLFLRGSCLQLPYMSDPSS